VAVSTDKRIVAYHIARLQNVSADVRLKAIEELRLIGDPDALDALQTLYRTDTNLDVRKAAQEAGRAIFLKQQMKQSV
jgi:hypothetical protein